VQIVNATEVDDPPQQYCTRSIPEITRRGNSTAWCLQTPGQTANPLNLQGVLLLDSSSLKGKSRDVRQMLVDDWPSLVPSLSWGDHMIGTITKRVRQDGKPARGYFFFAGRTSIGKRIQITKSAFDTTEDATQAYWAAPSDNGANQLTFWAGPMALTNTRNIDLRAKTVERLLKSGGPDPPVRISAAEG
jgi:hypothetical protein